jgi:hypothetical protein
MENGTVVNQYKVISQIGKVGLCEPFRARDSKPEPEVTIKGPAG